MNVAIIFAGGIGRRMNQNALPKQFLKLHGKEIIIHTLEHFQNHKEIDAIVIACVKEWIAHLQLLLDKFDVNKVTAVVPGGDTGQMSIYNGLKKAKDLYGENVNVLIHDGVRPLIQEKTISDCLKSVYENGTAITVAPVTETIIRMSSEFEIESVIDRTNCLLARAPQGFRLMEILESHEKALAEGKTNFIDCATIMKWNQYKLSVVEGPVENIKITTPMDFFTFKALVEARESAELFGV